MGGGGVVSWFGARGVCVDFFFIVVLLLGRRLEKVGGCVAFR